MLGFSRRAAAFLRRFPTRLRPEEVSEVESSVEEATSEPVAVDDRRRLRLLGTGGMDHSSATNRDYLENTARASPLRA